MKLAVHNHRCDNCDKEYQVDSYDCSCNLDYPYEPLSTFSLCEPCIIQTPIKYRKTENETLLQKVWPSRS